MNPQYKTNYVHLFFLTFLFLHYLFPLILGGQIVVEPHDILDGTVVNDHIISKIYKGDIESLNYFLSGEIKWYYLDQLFYPTNIFSFVLISYRDFLLVLGFLHYSKFM